MSITKRQKDHKNRSFTQAVCLMLALCVVIALLFAPLAQAMNWNSDGEKSDSGGNRGNTEPLKGGDPVAASNGAYGFTLPLLDLGGPMDLHFSLIYRSDLSNWIGNDDFPKWRYSPFWWNPKCVARLWVHPDQFWLEDFRMVAFNGTTGEIDESHEAQPVRYVMKKTDDYVYLMDPIWERIYIFNKSNALLRYIMDRNGNKLVYSYDGDKLTQISDGLGRELNFTHADISGDDVLTKVIDQAGRKILLNYEENAPDNGNELTLRSVTDTLGNNITFNYTTLPDTPGYIDLIINVTWPKGNTPYTQEYTFAELDGIEAARVSKQTDAYNNQVQFSYGPSKNQVNITWADNNQSVYQHYSHHQPPKSMTDAEGKSINFAKNDHDQMTSITDRLGDTTNISYHQESGKIASIKNNKGDYLNFTYTAQNQIFTNLENGEQFNFTFYNPARIDYPDGTHGEFTYDDKGNILTWTNTAEKVWHYEYNSRGQVTKIKNPADGTIELVYNSDGTTASSRDSDTGITTFGYDTYKRLNKITHPDGKSIQITYNLNDKITSITDENDHTSTYEYDANGNFIKFTDPAGKETHYVYDLIDEVKKVINRLGKETNFTYDERGRLISITDANGNTVNHQYTTTGWLKGITVGGQTWQIGHDDEGIISSRTTPLGYTTEIETDKSGRVIGITDPMGNTFNLTRDSIGSITSLTNPFGKKTNFIPMTVGGYYPALPRLLSAR